MEERDGTRGRWFGSDVPAVRHEKRSSECADRLSSTTAPPSRRSGWGRCGSDRACSISCTSLHRCSRPSALATLSTSNGIFGIFRGGKERIIAIQDLIPGLNPGGVYREAFMKSLRTQSTLAPLAFVAALCTSSATLAQYESNIRVLKLTDYLTAFYDGRPATPPPKTDKPRTWVEYGSMDLGIASYVIHHGDRAVVYDTLPTVQQARWVRDYLEKMGIKRFTVVNSHFHLDHVGGNEAYRDEVIIASKGTLQTLAARKEAIETGKFWGPPAVSPLVLPNAVFERRMDITIGEITVELHNVNIHTPDSVVAYIPKDKIVLPGDTIEDSVVFISNPSNVVEQIDNLAEFGRWDITRLYPNHGNIEVIRKGGYDKGLIEATRIYLRNMVRRAKDEGFLEMPIEAVIGESLSKGWITLWEPYRHVHDVNRKRLYELYKDKPLPVIKD